MNKELMQQAGFHVEVTNVNAGRCAFDSTGSHDTSKFTDELSAREFEISGLCQACQDDIFGGE